MLDRVINSVQKMLRVTGSIHNASNLRPVTRFALISLTFRGVFVDFDEKWH